MQPSTSKMHAINNACLQSNAAHELVIKSRWMWITPLFSAGLLLTIGIAIFFFVPKDILLIAFLPLGIVVAILNRSPLTTQLAVDFVRQEIVFTAFYLLQWPQRTTIILPSKSLREVSQKQFKTHLVYLYTTRRHHWVLDFGKQDDEATLTAQRLQPLIQRPTIAPAVDTVGSLTAEEATPASTSQEALTPIQITHNLNQQLQSWARLQMLLGVFSMIDVRGFSTWGSLLIVLGLGAFYFRTAAMFLVYMVTFIWIAIFNLVYSDGLWKGVALLQFWWAFSLWRLFQNFHQQEKKCVAASNPQLNPNVASINTTAFEPEPVAPPAVGVLPGLARAQAVFPWVALGASVSGILGLGLSIVGLVVSSAFELDTFSPIFRLLSELSLAAGLLGFGVGLAAWLGTYPYKLAAIVGCILGGLAQLLIFGLFLLNIFLS